MGFFIQYSVVVVVVVVFLFKRTKTGVRVQTNTADMMQVEYVPTSTKDVFFLLTAG